MNDTTRNKLIHDWNTTPNILPTRTVGIVDETLRDGLQSPSVTQPPVADKLALLALMAKLDVDDVNLGIPGAGSRFAEECLILAREIVDRRLPLACHCAARTLPADIAPIAEISQQAGVRVGVGMFIGSSPIRRYAEGWDLALMLRRTREAIDFAVKHDVPVIFVTEDTTRADPETLRQLYLTAIEHGAERICLCDTAGHATPEGTRRLVRFIREVVGPEIGIDWHGHNDRGMALVNAIAALEAGADRLHATALGIGERTGNTSMELLLTNLELLGYIRRDLTPLSQYCRVVAQVCNIPMPAGHPVVGRDAFRTASGIHAAAIYKAQQKGDDWLADRVYSAVPAALIGRYQKIEIGPMSGASNVRYQLADYGLEASDEMIQHILEVAKQSDRVLTEVEVLRLLVGAKPRRRE